VGQTVHVTEGVGRIQARGGDVVEIHPGDTVYTPRRGVALARRRTRPLHDPPRDLGGTGDRPRDRVGRAGPRSGTRRDAHEDQAMSAQEGGRPFLR
jgi:hypothetical protein